ncbi:hypothetical protein J6O48_12510 [bacterium]|nr:hypothetical protein [bacterium]
MTVQDNSAIINQVYLKLAPKGVSYESIEKLDTTLLHELLSKIDNNEDTETILGYTLERVPDLADEETLQKNREIRQENGDTIIDEKNGEELAQRTILHQEGEDVIETVITYINGTPSSKTIKKNGNTKETSTYSEDNIDGYGGHVIIITTDKTKSDGSRIRTIVSNVDKNGNFTDEAFLQRKTTALSGKITFVSKDDAGNIRVKTGNSTKIYNGSSITQFDNNQLNPITQVNTERKTDDAVYTTVKQMYEKLDQTYDRTSLSGENHRQIFDLFDKNPKDGILKKEEVLQILEFIKNSLGITDNSDIKESDIQAISKVLQNLGIENADFKGFLDNLLFNTSLSRVVSTKRTSNPNVGGYRTITRYDDGRTTIRDFYSNGDLLHIRYQGELGYKDPTIAEEFGGEYIARTLRARSAVFTNSASDETKLVNLYHKEAFSLKYGKLLQEQAFNLFRRENFEVEGMLDKTLNMWEALANTVIEGYTALNGTTSLTDEEYAAKSNISRSDALKDGEVILYQTGKDDYLLIDDIRRDDLVKFENTFKEIFGKKFQYALVTPLIASHNEYTTASSMYAQIKKIEDVLSLTTGRRASDILDNFKTIQEDEIKALERYGFTIKLVDDTNEIPRTGEARDANIYYSKNDLLIGHGDNLKAKTILAICEILGNDNPMLEELTKPEYLEKDTLFWKGILSNIEKQLKQTMMDTISSNTKGDRSTEYNEDVVENYIDKTYEQYKKYYTELFGQNPPDKKRIENMLMVRGIAAQTIQMAVVIAVTQGLGSAISSEMMLGINAAKAGKDAQGAARMFQWISSKYGDEAATQFAAHLTRISGVAIMPALNYATAVSDEERAAILDSAPEMMTYGLFGSYVSGPFGEAVKTIVGKQGAGLCTKLLNNAIGLSGEISADALFETILSGENIFDSLGSNAQGNITGNMMSMLIGGRANKAARMSSKYKVELEIKNGQKYYNVSQDGHLLCSTNKPEEIVTGILAKEVSDVVREQVQHEQTQIKEHSNNIEYEVSPEYANQVEEVYNPKLELLKVRFSESELNYLRDMGEKYPDLVERLIDVYQSNQDLSFSSIQKIINERIRLKEDFNSIEQKLIDDAIFEQSIKRFSDSEKTYLRVIAKDYPELAQRLVIDQQHGQDLSFSSIQKIINEKIRLKEDFAGVEQNLVDNAYFEQGISRFSDSEKMKLRTLENENPNVVRRLISIDDSGYQYDYSIIEDLVHESAQLKQELPYVSQATLADMLSSFSADNIREFFTEHNIRGKAQLKLLDECLSDIHSLNVVNVTTVKDLYYHHKFKWNSDSPGTGVLYSALADGHLNIQDPKIKDFIYGLVDKAEETEYKFYLDDAIALVDAVNNMNGNYSTLISTYGTRYENDGSYGRDNDGTPAIEYEPHVRFSRYARSEHGVSVEQLKNSDNESDSRVYDDFMIDTKFSRMMEFIKTNPKSEISDYLYETYYIQHLIDTNVPQHVIDKCIEINQKYNVKIKLPSDVRLPDRAMEFIEKELDMWKEASNGQAKYPPVIDFNLARENWLKGAAAYAQPGYNGAQTYPEFTLYALMCAMRHETTHTNDLKLGENIDPKYNLDEILPHHVEIIDGKPKRVNDPKKCPFYNELKKLGFSDSEIDYACTNTKEFIAVCSEGPLSKYSPELKQVLIDFGMPEWMFNLKEHIVEDID